jgi:hypothetical protein
VLQEACEILQGLSVALLFDTASVSEVWLEVVDRSMKFLVDIQKRCVWGVGREGGRREGGGREGGRGWGGRE